MDKTGYIISIIIFCLIATIINGLIIGPLVMFFLNIFSDPEVLSSIAKAALALDSPKKFVGELSNPQNIKKTIDLILNLPGIIIHGIQYGLALSLRGAIAGLIVSIILGLVSKEPSELEYYQYYPIITCCNAAAIISWPVFFLLYSRHDFAPMSWTFWFCFYIFFAVVAIGVANSIGIFWYDKSEGSPAANDQREAGCLAGCAVALVSFPIFGFLVPWIYTFMVGEILSNGNLTMYLPYHSSFIIGIPVGWKCVMTLYQYVYRD